LIKVAATDVGITAIEELTALGVSVNVTLLFSVHRYQQAIGAYWRGLERRAAAGEPLADVFSVASFFVSRVDAAVDPRLAPDSPLRGRIAIANAQFAYVRYLEVLEGFLWQGLAAKGARPQRPLWASTGTKDRSYSDVRYVQELIAPGVINTMPLETLLAFLGHSDVGASMGADRDSPKRLLRELAEADVDFRAITEELEQAGIDSFRDSYGELLGRIEQKASELSVDDREHAHV
jgi:transaldolase